MMSRDAGIYYRVKLLKSISVLKLSESTGEKITTLIRKAPQGSKESTAENIVKKMENCKTEKEVIETLGLK